MVNFERPRNAYESKDKIKDKIIDDAIKSKAFSIDVVLLMIQESRADNLWLDEFIQNQDNDIDDVLESIENIEGNLEDIFRRKLLMAVIKRPDCPADVATKFAEEAFADVKENIRKKSKVK